MVDGLFVQVEAARGAAAPGNTAPADLLVVVTKISDGTDVADLQQSDFFVTCHQTPPGANCGFSGNIVFFRSVGTGAYQIQLGLPQSRPGCVWVSGEYLMQVSARSNTGAGQGTAKLTIE